MSDSRPTSTRRRALKYAGLTGLSGVAGLTGLSLTSQPALALSESVTLPSGITSGTVNVSSYELQYAELDTSSDITITYILRTQSKTVNETHKVSITDSTGAVMTSPHSITVPSGEVTLQVQLEHPSVGTVSTQESAPITIDSPVPDSVTSRTADDTTTYRPDLAGLKIELTSDWPSIAARISSKTSGATRAYLCDSNRNTITSVDVSGLSSGDVFSFDNVGLSSGNRYYIMLDAEGADYTIGYYYHSSPGYPFTGPDLDIIGRYTEAHGSDQQTDPICVTDVGNPDGVL